jgi:hypothetical protein
MSIIGSTKLAVLPVPVWAMAIRSRIISTLGMACAWIGVGSSYPAATTDASNSSDRPISANFMSGYGPKNQGCPNPGCGRRNRPFRSGSPRAFARFSRCPHVCWRALGAIVPQSQENPGPAPCSVTAFDQLAQPGKLAVGAAARQQGIAIDAQLAVGGTRHVKARIEILRPARTFQRRRHDPSITHEQQQAARPVGLHAGDPGDGDTLADLAFDEARPDFAAMAGRPGNWAARAPRAARCGWSCAARSAPGWPLRRGSFRR